MKTENLTFNELEAGKHYWLDDVKDESGIFVKHTDHAVYFKPNEDCKYLVITENSQIDKDTVGLVQFKKPGEGLFHLKY